MPDLRKLYEKADKYLERQKFEAAFEAYQEILRFDPDDEEILVILGDLSQMLNRTVEAQTYLSQLTDHYIRRHDLAKAVATCRKTLKIAPRDVGTMGRLAGLLERSDKDTEALEMYREALRHYRDLGATSPALECLNHIVTLDPDSLPEHEELGELASSSRQPAIAARAFLRAAELARQGQDEGRWEKLVEKAHATDPANEAASIAATELFLKRGVAAQAVELIDPLLAKRPEDLAVLELACRAYLDAEDPAKARPLCWRLYQAQPERVDLLLELLELMLRKGSAPQVWGMVNELKDRLIQQGKRNEFLRIVEKLYECDESNLEVLELLSGLYSDANQEEGLRRSLSRLFSLYLAGEHYPKAADTLERILDVDPYGEGHNDRLLNLEGHIDAILYKNIHSRLQPPSAAKPAQAATPAGAGRAAEKAETLEDLLVEGEMYHQYQLAAKLQETLQKLDRLFPGAHEKHQALRELYEAAGYTPKFQAPNPPVQAVVSAQPDVAPAATTSPSVDDVRRVSEVTASIYRESTPEGILQVAVQEVGKALNASRCWAALGTFDLPPEVTAEYRSRGAPPSDAAALHAMFAALMSDATAHPEGWTYDVTRPASSLPDLEADMQRMVILSLLALPLLDAREAMGLLLVQQLDAPRAWSHGERVFVKAIATQVVIAVNNTKLRRLVHSLAGADSETGLLPRSSYLDCLLAEAQRSKDAGQPLSVCVLEPENPRALLKQLGDAGVQQFIQQISKAMIPALHHHDIPIRYSPLAVVVVFPDTGLPQAGLALEKMRRAVAQIRMNGASPPAFCAALCDVPLGPTFHAVDGVTEVINRLEASLERAHKEGPKRVFISKFAA